MTVTAPIACESRTTGAATIRSRPSPVVTGWRRSTASRATGSTSSGTPADVRSSSASVSPSCMKAAMSRTVGLAMRKSRSSRWMSAALCGDRRSESSSATASAVAVAASSRSFWPPRSNILISRKPSMPMTAATTIATSSARRTRNESGTRQRLRAGPASVPAGSTGIRRSASSLIVSRAARRGALPHRGGCARGSGPASAGHSPKLA